MRQHVARLGDVHGAQRDEELFRRDVGACELGQLIVVGLTGRERLLKDGRVRGNTCDGVLLDHPLELARADKVT